MTKTWAKLHADERTNLIENYCQVGDTAATVIQKLESIGVKGQTRNAVIGHVNRHMRPKFHLAKSTKKNPKTKLPEKPAKKPKPRPPRKFTPNWKKRPELSELEEPHSKNLHLLDLTDYVCKYAYGDTDFRFCGHPVAQTEPTSRYCEYHHILTTQPLRR